MGSVNRQRASLTVIIPHYNHGHLIGRQLRAVMTQTVRAERVVIIDDASTDGSLAAIEALLCEYPDVELVRASRNEGTLRQVNKALQQVTSNCVVFLAADDEVMPRFFERNMALLERHPKAGLSSGATIVCRNDVRRELPKAHAEPVTSDGYVSPDRVLKHFLSGPDWIMCNVTIWRTLPLKELGGFPEHLKSYTDHFIGRMLALRHGACYCPEILATFFVQENSYSSTFTGATALSVIHEARLLMEGRFRDVCPRVLVDRSNALMMDAYLASAIGGAVDQVRKTQRGPNPSEMRSRIGVIENSLLAVRLLVFLLFRSRELIRVTMSRFNRG